MARYIDADKLIDFIDAGHLRNPNELCFSETDVVNMLNNAPTAYDVETKVAELERVSFERFGNDGMGGQKVVSLDNAISIVRGKE